MLQCWDVKPEERPSFFDLKSRFEAMLLETTNYLQFTALTEGCVMNRTQNVYSPKLALLCSRTVLLYTVINVVSHISVIFITAWVRSCKLLASSLQWFSQWDRFRSGSFTTTCCQEYQSSWKVYTCTIKDIIIIIHLSYAKHSVVTIDAYNYACTL